MRLFLRDEKLRMGILNTEQGNDVQSLICTHDIIHNNPRIIVCYELYKEFSKLARFGILRHEAAHMALHGSLEFRIFRIPEECRHTATIKGLDMPTLDTALNYLAAAVMDIEATKFLIKHEYIDCQAQFALELLEPSDKDKETWKGIKLNRPAKFLFLTALLRPILFVQPILDLPRSKKFSAERQIMLNGKIERFVEYLENTEQNKLVQVANIIADSLTEDTHNNVDSTLIHALALA
ncbi:MAG TPA: hypothetical protein DCX22_01120 [Dehalococcoidia bacterium]|nr:hypothetical protein [Dehalococcoidia bacterium]